MGLQATIGATLPARAETFVLDMILQSGRSFEHESLTLLLNEAD
jgi:hypothetical protein